MLVCCQFFNSPTRESHFSRDLGKEVPKTQGYPIHCDTDLKQASRHLLKSEATFTST